MGGARELALKHMCTYTHIHTETSHGAGVTGSTLIFPGWWEPALLRQCCVMSAQTQNTWKLMKSVLYLKKGAGSLIFHLRWETEGDGAECSLEGEKMLPDDSSCELCQWEIWKGAWLKTAIMLNPSHEHWMRKKKSLQDKDTLTEYIQVTVCSVLR